MKRAIINTGGKQYIVAEGQKVAVDAQAGKVGDEITFSSVLGLLDGAKSQIGQPEIKGQVTAKIVAQKKTPKVVVAKFKRKKRYRRAGSHRQQMTVVQVAKINV